jgi:hypothetical protein
VPRRVTVAALTAILSIAAAACGGDNEPPPREEVVVTSEDAVFGGLLGQIRGHYRVALELARGGDKSRAGIHSSHPIAEILAVVSERIHENDAAAADALKQRLASVAKVFADGEPADRIKAAIEDAAMAVERAEAAVIGDARSTVAYRASVVGSLLLASAGEYAEAVADGTVRRLIEFQDAYGFLSEAKQIYGGIRAQVKRASAAKEAEIAKAFAMLDKAVPGVAPPAKVSATGAVERAVSLVGQRLEETVHAFAVDYLSPEEAFANVDEFLSDVVAEYAKGRRQAADSLIRKAYLENYEIVEAKVIWLAPELNEELEPLLSEVLQEKIRGGISVEGLRTLVERVRALAVRARDAVLEAE